MCEVVPLLSARREEIRAVGKLYRELALSVGETTASAVLVEAILNQARALGQKLAPVDPAQRSLENFSRVFEEHYFDGGMELARKKCDEASLEMEIARCDYPALYNASDLPKDIAQALTCAGEAAFAQGYDHRVRLVRCDPACESSKACYLMFVWDEYHRRPKESAKVKLKVHQD